MRLHHLMLLLCCLIVSSLSGCVSTGPGGKQSFIIIPESQEIAIGAGMAEEVDKTEKRLADEDWQRYLREVGQKIVNVSDRKGLTYSFTVIESDEINAFAAPGGYIYFYTGLLKAMENESELAAVMAHEISHVVARHGVKRMQTVMGASLVYQLVFGEQEQSQALQAAIGIGMNLAFSGYSREAEREADEFGIQYMVAAGYDPAGAITMFEKLAAAGGTSSGESSVFEKLASSHPETQERIANAKAQIASLQATGSAKLQLGRDRYQTMKKRLPK